MHFKSSGIGMRAWNKFRTTDKIYSSIKWRLVWISAFSQTVCSEDRFCNQNVFPGLFFLFLLFKNFSCFFLPGLIKAKPSSRRQYHWGRGAPATTMSTRLQSRRPHTARAVAEHCHSLFKLYSITQTLITHTTLSIHCHKVSM